MLVLITLVGVLSVIPPLVPPVQSPQVLHCRIELAAGAKSQRCQVSVPPGGGRAIRPCGDADRQAGHCDAAGHGRYVAWVVGTGPGRCRITDKKTSWKRGVVSAKLSKSVGGPSTCDLYVELR